MSAQWHEVTDPSSGNRYWSFFITMSSLLTAGTSRFDDQGNSTWENPHIMATPAVAPKMTFQVPTIPEARCVHEGPLQKKVHGSLRSVHLPNHTPARRPSCTHTRAPSALRQPILFSMPAAVGPGSTASCAVRCYPYTPRKTSRATSRKPRYPGMLNPRQVACLARAMCVHIRALPIRSPWTSPARTRPACSSG